MAKLIKGDKQYALIINKKQLCLIKTLIGNIAGTVQECPERCDNELYKILRNEVIDVSYLTVFEVDIDGELHSPFKLKQKFIDSKEE